MVYILIIYYCINTNTMKAIITILIISFAVSTGAFAQDKRDNPIATAIENKEYVFKVRSIMPATGGTRQVNSNYDFTVNDDTLISYLPYFGRAYSAQIGGGNDPLNFTSNDFTYKVTEGKKGGWMIEIKPKDARDIQVMNLSLSKNGYGTLYVNQQNRQAISYSGRIEPLKKKV